MADVSDDLRTARFRCVIAIAIPGGSMLTVEGVCEGRITREERGEGGFGYDSLFIPRGEAQTFAEMTARRKDAISHRGIAARRAAAILEGLVLEAEPGDR
jgi:XTP/dITP diphosphohydrolase